MDTYMKITLKLLVNKETNKVVFAESGEYFVQLLLAFLSYSLSGISRGFGNRSMIGCIDALSKSAEALEASYFRSETSKKMLCKPGYFCSPKFHFYVKMFGLSGNECTCGISLEQINPAIGTGKFMITDDLRVNKVSFETAGLPILHKFGIVDGSAFEEKFINVGKKEVLELFKYSPLSGTPITDAFLKPEEIIRNSKRIKTEPLDMNPLPFDQTVLDSIKRFP
ncbi:hypothetical protein FRX31_005929 [Thalictrum thalictroides]|uniref:Uncharacterized protein n=1 Tax=Thalictrum thalictroides TaxID=46969 RepID=A0A7J6X488_THATH|nr:hypothetical protein FRX31_005929 [Thalictrum thalictroides]